MPRPHIFADGPGNTASGVQVNENLDYEEGLITAEAASRSAGDSAVLAALSLLVPIGAELGWYGSADPAGGQFMIPDGRAISRTTYATLFNLPGFGTTHGVGDGVTTFNIPNHLGRVGLAAGTANPAVAGGSAHALGAKGGEETHVLTVPELAGHTHDFLNNEETFNFTVVNLQTGATPITLITGPSNLTTGGMTGSVGGASHNNLPPHIVKNMIIRVL